MLPSNITKHELVGLQMEVLDSTDHSLRGLTGIVVDETKNTLRIEANNRIKTLPKRLISLRLRLPEGQTVVADGSLFCGRPEDRLTRRS